jgi:hypothetical protein
MNRAAIAACGFDPRAQRLHQRDGQGPGLPRGGGQRRDVDRLRAGGLGGPGGAFLDQPGLGLRAGQGGLKTQGRGQQGVVAEDLDHLRRRGWEIAEQGRQAV